MISKRFLEISKLVTIFALCVSVFSMSFSSETSASTKDNQGSPLLKQEIMEIDLSKRVEQKRTFINENGNEVTVGAKPVIDNEKNIPVGDQSWKIYYYESPYVDMEYWIDTKRDNSGSTIEKAYNESISSVGGSISETKFTYDSKQANYSALFTCSGNDCTTSVYLRAYIEGESSLRLDARTP